MSRPLSGLLAGARISVNQFMVPELPLPDLARWCASRAVTGVGVLLGTVRSMGPAKVGAVLADHGIRPTSVCVALGLIDPDPDRRADLLLDATDAVAEAAELGVPLVVVTGGPARGFSLSEARQMATDHLQKLAAVAQVAGTKVLIEPLHPVLVHLSAFTTLREAALVAAALAEVEVVLDTWHLWTDPALAETLDAFADEVGMVHLSDWAEGGSMTTDRQLPGDGVADLPHLVARIAEKGYAGWWEMEVLSAGLRRGRDPFTFLDMCLDATRTVLHAAGRLATTAGPTRMRAAR